MTIHDDHDGDTKFWCAVCGWLRGDEAEHYSEQHGCGTLLIERESAEGGEAR